MLVTPSGIMTDLRRKHSLKASSPILVTPSGIVTDLRLWLLSKKAPAADAGDRFAVVPGPPAA
jgi:hypothetical protein